MTIESENRRVGTRYTCDRCGAVSVLADPSPTTVSDEPEGWARIAWAPIGAVDATSSFFGSRSGIPHAIGDLCADCALIVKGWTR